MVKPPTKTLVNKKNLLNYTSNTLLEYNPSKKSRQEINRENYQKHKDERKKQRRERYAQQKEQTELSTKQTHSKYYQATNIKILLTLKEYTELNQQKRKLWLDFTTTLHQLSQGITTIEEVMRLEQLADNLIRGYQETAKKELQKGKSWSLLDYDEQQKLIRYWGYEKARIENNFLTTAEKLERKSQEYLKEIERAKFHEERGKVKCECWQCTESQRIQGEIKKGLFKEDKTEKEQCSECQKWVKELDEEAGVCKSCKKKYE